MCRIFWAVCCLSSMVLFINTIVVFSILSNLGDISAEQNASPINFINKVQNDKLIIDTDMGSDDAVAVLLTLRHLALNPEINKKIIAITCVYGNTALDNVKMNVLKTLKVAGELYNIPVYAGSNGSILVTPPSDYYFGQDGLGDFDFPNPPDINLIQNETGVLALTRLVRENPGEITIVAIGPLTNIAMAIRFDPSFRKNVKQIYILGGNVNGYGNMPPNVEFNFYQDAEAAFIVLNSTDSSMNPLVLLPWDTCYLKGKIPMSWRRDQLGKLDSVYIQYLNAAERINSNNTNTIWWSSDGMLAAVVIKPSLVLNYENRYVEVVLSAGYRAGLMVDRANVLSRFKNTKIITDYDIETYKNLLMKDLA